MRSDTQIAKVTAGTTLKFTVGGIPELTREDVLGALGYAQSRVPKDRIGIHLVLARYALDEYSQEVLESSILKLAWDLWLKDRRKGYTSVNAMSGLARLAVHDWCYTQQVRKASDSSIARFVGVDLKTWRKRYLAHYGRVMLYLSRLESEVLAVITRALSSQP